MSQVVYNTDLIGRFRVSDNSVNSDELFDPISLDVQELIMERTLGYENWSLVKSYVFADYESQSGTISISGDQITGSGTSFLSLPENVYQISADDIDNVAVVSWQSNVTGTLLTNYDDVTNNAWSGRWIPREIYDFYYGTEYSGFDGRTRKWSGVKYMLIPFVYSSYLEQTDFTMQGIGVMSANPEIGDKANIAQLMKKVNSSYNQGLMRRKEAFQYLDCVDNTLLDEWDCDYIKILPRNYIKNQRI